MVPGAEGPTLAVPAEGEWAVGDGDTWNLISIHSAI